MKEISQSKEITAEKITFLRKRKHWTQTQIANKIKITRSRYASFESTRIEADFQTISDLCEVYGITLDEFKNLKIPVSERNRIQ